MNNIVNLGIFQEAISLGRHSNSSVKLLKELCHTFHQLHQMRAFEYLDNVIKHQNWSEMSLDIMIAYLRYNYTVKNELVEWQPALLKIKEELIKRGENVKEELQGLI